MAYGRGRTYGRKRYGSYRKKFSRYPKKGMSGMRKAPYQRKGFKSVYRQVRNTGMNELKCIDVPSAAVGSETTPSEVALTSTMRPFCLNDIPVGTDYNQRIGRKVTIRSVNISGEIRNGAVDNQKGTFVRILLVWDRTPNKVALAASTTFNDVLTGQMGDGTAITLASDSGFFGGVIPPNLANRDRYIILRDKKFDFPPIEYATGPIVGAGATKCAKFHISKKLNAQTIFADNTATLSPTGVTIQTGRLFMMIYASTDTIFYCRFLSRVRYTDS